ncbi:DUF1822 family protein [Parathermosynechococcus lividus]
MTMILRSASFPFLPEVPLIEHIDIGALAASDRQWINRIKNAARAHCRGRVYLNALAYVAVRNWFRTMGIEAQPKVPVDEIELPCFWEFVNGSALDTPMGRVVILPDEITDLEEWVVPREWLDIPAWRPDYFIGVQVLTDQELSKINLWGYAYASEVAKDTYDPLLRTYRIDRQQMVEDVALLLSLPAQEPRPLSLPDPELVSADLIHAIASGEIVLPRFVLSLDQWAQLLSQPQHRLSLFLACHPQRLGLWLRAREYLIRDCLQATWQELTDILPPSLDRRLGHVRAAELPSIDPDSREAIAAQQQLRQIKTNLNDPASKAALKSLITHPPSEDIRWQAAELLHDHTDPDPTAGSWKVRKVDLGIALDGTTLALTMAVLPRDATSAHLFVRVTPLSADAFLPAGLSLEIVTETGDRFARLTSRAEDQVVQYKFWGDIGEAFGIILEYGGARITESFVV